MGNAELALALPKWQKEPLEILLLARGVGGAALEEKILI